jgi:hypothetical protein
VDAGFPQKMRPTRRSAFSGKVDGGFPQKMRPDRKPGIFPEKWTPVPQKMPPTKNARPAEREGNHTRIGIST